MTELEEIQRRIELKLQFIELLDEQRNKAAKETLRLMAKKRKIENDKAES